MDPCLPLNLVPAEPAPFGMLDLDLLELPLPRISTKAVVELPEVAMEEKPAPKRGNDLPRFV